MKSTRTRHSGARKGKAALGGVPRAEDDPSHRPGGIDEFKAAPKEKDRWDKAAVVSQLLSGVALGAFGILITFWIAKTQASVATSQVEVARQQRTSEYLKCIAEAGPDKAGSLIGGLDLVMPENALNFAQYYAVDGQSESARISALHLLGRLARRPDPSGQSGQSTKARRTLMDISKAHSDDLIGDHARIALGETVTAVRVRLSNLDDIGRVSVNNQKVIERGLGSFPWVDISNDLKPGDNEILFELINGPYGGWSGRFEIATPWHSYDSGLLADTACPCNGPVMQIYVHVILDNDRQVTDIYKYRTQYFETNKPAGI